MLEEESRCWDDFLENWEESISWKERFEYIELLNKRFALNLSLRNCSRTIPVSARKLRADLFGKL